MTLTNESPLHGERVSEGETVDVESNMRTVTYLQTEKTKTSDTEGMREGERGGVRHLDEDKDCRSDWQVR